MEGAPEAIAPPSRAGQPSRRIALVEMAGLPTTILLIDQLTKAWVRAELTLGQPLSVVGENVRLLYIHNEGAAFGLSVGRYSSTVFLVLATIASALVFYLLLSTPREERLPRLALGLILGGALGNIVDRVRWDMVVDFIQVGIGGHYWPIFNVADSAVTVGAVLLGTTYLFRR